MRHAPYSTFSHATALAAAPTSPSGLAAFGARVLWLLALPRRMATIRRDMAILGQMTGAELSDIGLARQDLWDAAALPLGQSPGALFMRRAAERRGAALSRRR